MDAEAIARLVAGLELPKDGALIAVVGATASGKTELALRLAEHLDGEIISADSVQIYTRFDVGSGKPTPEERARAPHHVIDCVDPLEPVDAASYARLAGSAIAGIRARGRVPIVCGGTFLWVKALVHGLVPTPEASPEIRARHRSIALALGRPALHEKLRDVDPEAFKRLHPNDLVRVSRALEVHELTGKALSAWQAEHAFGTTVHPARFVGVDRPADEVTARIERRARKWLEAGWIDEVRALGQAGYDEARAMGSVGYREVRAHLRGEIPTEELLVSIVRATRIFARRQRTWLHHADVRWVPAPPP